MAKRLKLRICRVITTTLQSCRSKDPSNLPANPVPSFSRLNTNHRSSSSTSTFVLPTSKLQTSSSQEQFTWQKEDKWHVIAKIYEDHPITPRRKIYTSSSDDNDHHLTFSHPPPAPPPSASEMKKKRRGKKKKTISTCRRSTTSSADSGWFSDDEETETLFSFSTDSAYSRPRNKRRSVRLKPAAAATAAAEEIPARLSMLKKLIPCTVDGKVKESFAIVKMSEDPYEDFKNSMADMVVEKQMFDPKDLEQLLECFLSLNSRRYHGVIVQAFSDIWEAIFTQPAVSKHQPRVLRRASF